MIDRCCSARSLVRAVVGVAMAVSIASGVAACGGSDVSTGPTSIPSSSVSPRPTPSSTLIPRPIPSPAPTPRPTPAPTTTTRPQGSVPAALAHYYHQEHYQVDEERNILIRDNAIYRFTITGRFADYAEEGYVIANNSQITFAATSPVDPALTLDRGHPAQWWMARDAIGSLELHLLFPERDGYGGDVGDDIYYVQ
jgi:hypothetical protein